jgi:DNA-binding transcriptional LysR family regulator
MELDQLRLLVDLVRTGSFTKVAEQNYITQPAVSSRIRKLEDELGTKLVERTTRKVIVTEEGRIFFNYAKEILRQIDEVKTLLVERQDRTVGAVRLATIHSIGLHELPAYLKLFINRYPQVNIHIEYQSAENVYHMVAEGEADLGIVAYPEARPNLVIVPFFQDELVVICNEKHSFADRETVRLQDLNECSFIAFAQGIPTRRAIDAVLRRHGIRINIRMQCDNIEILKKMVEVGLGASIVPAFSVQQEVRLGALKSLVISNYSMKRPLAIVHRKGKSLSRAVQAFLELLVSTPLEAGFVASATGG